MKRCSRCGETKPLPAFGVRLERKGAPTSRCKPCAVLATKACREKDVEAARARRRARYAANVEAERAAALQRYRADPGTSHERAREWRKANPARVRAAKVKWRAANPEKAEAHWRRRKARKRAVAFDPHVTLADVIALDGPNCYICGVECDPSAPPRTRFKAELEHVIPLAKGGPHTLANLKCACYPCNLIKSDRLTAEDVRGMFA